MAATTDPAIHASRDSIEDVWGPRHGYYGNWSERVDHRQIATPDRWVQSACVLCSNGCAMDVGVKHGEIVAVRGRAVDKVNRGRLGPKGMHASIGMNKHKDRLLYPQIRDATTGQLRRASWDEAMSLIVSKTQEIIREFTQHAISFYCTGQLMLEEYYTLAIIGKAGISTNHMDGNTRLCTATAAAAMRESFGTDGQVGSYTDIDYADCIMLTGHNMSATQTVLWSRILDRLAGPQPPKIVVIDPRRTSCAEVATVHLSPKIGTNVAVLNGLQRLLMHNGHIDKDYISQHVVGFDELSRVVEMYTPEKVEEISGVPASKLVAAADILGTCTKLLSTALQGVYQSYQATAAACQLNNINLMRGMIGKPGCGILQMNGQPTAQNNRECGCDGEYTGFRNHMNPAHIADLAEHWNVNPEQISHWHDPTHIMSMLHYIENSTIKMMWVMGTNPAVSLPQLGRVRELFGKKDLFLIVQDIFPTETTALADVVLPAAMWGEKTGVFTNVDRTVHIAEKAVEPPGECRSDLDIFLDFSARMGFKDKDGEPLIKWTTSEQAYDAWRKCSAKTFCDYSEMSYAKLRGGSGIQWPCNEANPNGTERLYEDGQFRTKVEDAETFGHDLVTGAAIPKDQYMAKDYPDGRAIFKSAHYYEPLEKPTAECPFWLTTGRVTHQFHTRTKTARSAELHRKAPEPFLQISDSDAQRLGIKEGDMVHVSNARSSIEVKARVGNIEVGCVFIPFHYGYWDSRDKSMLRAANELTSTSWCPVSKQPFLKYGAVNVVKSDGVGKVAIYDKHTGRTEGSGGKQAAVQPGSMAASKSVHQRVAEYMGVFVADLAELRQLYEMCADIHKKSYELHSGFGVMCEISDNIMALITQFTEKYEAKKDSAVSPLFSSITPVVLDSGMTNYDTLMRITNMYTLVQHTDIQTTAMLQMANANQDMKLVKALMTISEQINRQTLWLTTNIKANSAQALLVPE